MITRKQLKEVTPTWQTELSNAITDPKALYEALDLPSNEVPNALKANKLFRLKVTQHYLSLIEKGNVNDPLLLQILPVIEESQAQPIEFTRNPVGDTEATKTPGLIHKYKGRALLITTGACAVHCRYCFRRHYPYAESQAGRDNWDAALNYLRENEDIEEIILSGGDPLTLSDKRLSELSKALESIPHLQRLRIHSRLVSVLPSRINDTFLDWVTRSRLQVVMVTHINHPHEISADVSKALQRLHLSNIHVLNQAVLLNSVNNDVSTLEILSKSLFKNDVMPYYLYILDKVEGAAHFDVSSTRATEIVEQLRHRLPGYMVPKLVVEEAGHGSKTSLI